MEKLFLISKRFLLLGLLFVFFSCTNDEQLKNDTQETTSKSFLEQKNVLKQNVFKGPQVAFGAGKVRSWISVGSDGFPIELGIEMTQKAFYNLPSIVNDESSISIPLHHKAKILTPFNHIGLNWNPSGHPPEGVFEVPHFDAHFYMITESERLAIPAWSPSSDALFNLYPPKGFMPKDYIVPPGPIGSEAQMGKHWLPENLRPYLPFSRIMVLGTYNGKFTFIEPMVTMDFLLSRNETEINFSQPELFQSVDNYPTRYNIYSDPKTGSVFITLSGFVKKIPLSF